MVEHRNCILLWEKLLTAWNRDNGKFKSFKLSIEVIFIICRFSNIKFNWSVERLKVINIIMDSKSDKTGKKQRFSVVQIKPKPEDPILKLSLSDDQTTELIRKVSEVDTREQDKVLTQIKIKDEANLNRHRPTLTKLKDFKLSPLNSGSQGEESHNLITVTEESQNGRKFTNENSSLYTKRLVEKNGSCNVIPRSSKRHRFLSDFYTTLSDLKWRYCLLISIAANISTWTLFAMIYYVIISIHQDVSNHDNPEWDACILNVNGFITCFLFSIETQHTIGYGFRAIKDNCPSAIVVWNMQSYVAIMISSLFCGLIVLKIMSPQYRSKLIRFSRQAVISFNNGFPVFIFRVIDFKESNLVNCNVKAVLIRDHVTKEGEFIPFYNRSLTLNIEETACSNLFLAWPVNVIHVIDSQSPLFGLTPRELQEEYLEIIVILEGVVENSGKLMQVCIILATQVSLNTLKICNCILIYMILICVYVLNGMQLVEKFYLKKNLFLFSKYSTCVWDHFLKDSSNSPKRHFHVLDSLLK